MRNQRFFGNNQPAEKRFYIAPGLITEQSK